jgi:membrane-associated phospholipid phosphatase
MSPKQAFALAAFTAVVAVAGALTARAAAILDVTNMNALEGLAPAAALGNSVTGKAALASNFTVTGDIQTGAAKQPLLLPFPDQQQQALRDTLITGVAYELADGLGSKLGPAYQATITHTPYCKNLEFTRYMPAVSDLVGFANATSRGDSDAAKFFLANETRAGTEPVSLEAQAILSVVNGTTDAFGKAYNLPAGSTEANPFGNARPLQTEPHFTAYSGKDFCGSETTNTDYLQHLLANPAYPAGHTVYGYIGSLLLALLVPERYQQMVTRAAEFGNDRIVLGAHYAMDVLGGRTLAEYDLAQLLANKTGYVGVERDNIKIDDFPRALAAARDELTAALEKACGGKIADCAAQDQGRFADPVKNSALYEVTQTYGLPVVFAKNAEGAEDVAKLAPEAGYLLTAAFPSLTLPQADAILTLTEGSGGGFLDNGSAFGVYSRLDLYKAAERTAAFLREGK